MVREIKYFAQVKVPNLFGEELFTLGLNVTVKGETKAEAYIDYIYAEIRRQMESTMKIEIPPNKIVIDCLSILDIYETE